jgi:hypothetical protein
MKKVTRKSTTSKTKVTKKAKSPKKIKTVKKAKVTKVPKPKKEKVVKVPKIKKEKPIITIEPDKKSVKIKSKKIESFLFRISSVSKTTFAITPDGVESEVGTYDFSNCFTKNYESVGQSIIGKFAEIPINCLTITPDASLYGEVLQNDTGGVVIPGSKLYNEWKANKAKLWKAKYNITVRVPGKAKASIEDLQSIFHI